MPREHLIWAVVNAFALRYSKILAKQQEENTINKIHGFKFNAYVVVAKK